MLRREAAGRPCVHAVLLNQPGTPPSSGKNKACASLWGAEFDKSSAANLAALACSWRLFQSSACQAREPRSLAAGSPAQCAAVPVSQGCLCLISGTATGAEQVGTKPDLPELPVSVDMVAETRAAAAAWAANSTGCPS